MKSINSSKILILVLCIFIMNVAVCFASSENVIVKISDEDILVNESEISVDADSDIYLSSNMNNGGSSDEAIAANKEVANVINISNAGTYEFTGTLTDGQIAVNTNGVKGDITIVLNNVNINCKNGPAILVYNKATKSDDCNVTIKTAKDSENVVTGVKIKQSVEGWSDQEKIVYNVEKNYSDEGEYFERYKYDGAISSDISINFDGEGILTINANKEGIESKRDITVDGGTIIINSSDDGINAAADGESVITINGGKVVVYTDKDGEEGDGIDSNGSIYINGGEVYSFANPTSEDSGIDSDKGIYINGGTVVATGNMYDEISDESKVKVATFQLNEKIDAGTLLAVLDENDNPITAFETDRAYTIITFTGVDNENCTVYVGGSIEGTKENGLYTNIISYEKGTKIEASILTDGRSGFNGGMMMKSGDNPMMNKSGEMQENKLSDTLLIAIGVCGIAILLVGIIITLKNKSSILVLIMGALAGAMLTFSISSLIRVEPEYSNNMMQQAPGGFERMQGNPDMEKMEKMEKPDGNMQS